MDIDAETIQRWIAGRELKIDKRHKPLKKTRVPVLRDYEKAYLHSEKIDLTRANNFRLHDGAENISMSVDNMLSGRRAYGNDVGLALATFRYTDKEQEDWDILVICAYQTTGLRPKKKERELKQCIVIALEKLMTITAE